MWQKEAKEEQRLRTHAMLCISPYLPKNKVLHDYDFWFIPLIDKPRMNALWNEMEERRKARENGNKSGDTTA